MLRLVREMKAEGVKPDFTIYNALLACVAQEGLPLEAWAVVDDMAAMGIPLDRQSYHHLLHACRWSSADTMWQVVDEMKRQGMEPDEQTYAFIIGRATTTESLELALQYMHEMENLGLVPLLTTAQDVIKLAAYMDLPKLAIEIAQHFESRSPRRLCSETWMLCLTSSADMLYAEGVKLCWNKVVHTSNLTPDEGACLSVLHTCARHGLSDLALDVMRVFRGLGVDPWYEHHFAPLVEALCKDGKLKEAFRTLDAMRKQCINPTSETVRPFTQYLQQNVDRVDDVWLILDQWRREGNTVDPLILNSIIQASVLLDDLQRAMGAYKSFPDYDCKPNVDTFNFLLSGCVAAKHRELGDKLLLELRQAAVKPNATTYEHIILLCLTQPVYGDAFFYLEEMKTQKFVPSARVYATIIQVCVAARDSRYSIALSEMHQCGYTLPSSVRRFLSDYGLSPHQDAAAAETETEGVRIF
ncbi:hypothetical protein L210DRAFT_911783 [Boletus edulis BED1]|uniref:Pentatricopeptide repeat-containing protein-mitochondrial domain-containing protein n=1 Tax=Boletus edulis BED1 TaxID=1328754 RepID=A0AAD4C0L8_BOLED|nr:hypothetical protein L210DRAFT_911783 [Boletus edulis BED1]